MSRRRKVRRIIATVIACLLIVQVATYLLFLLGQVIWLTYGVRFGLLEIVLGMSANLAGNLAVLLSALRFRTRAA